MENQFCENCNNSMYIYLDKDSSKLYLYCKACNNKADYNKNLIYDNDFNIDLSESINNNKYLSLDVTIPKIKNNKLFKCPNDQCKSIVENKPSNISYVKYDYKNIKYIYICNYCNQKWNN